jgi:hypothetical protein
MKDLEDPYYNQVLYVPTLTYNLYDGFSPGMRLHNKTILDKPFTFDVNPAYSTNAKSFSGSVLLLSIKIIETPRFTTYAIHFRVYFHYAPCCLFKKSIHGQESGKMT